MVSMPGDVRGIPAERLKESVKTLVPGKMRGERIDHHGILIFNDCYNSNPDAASLPAYTMNNVDVAYVNQPHTIRWLNTPQFIDNFSWIRGSHQVTWL